MEIYNNMTNSIEVFLPKIPNPLIIDIEDYNLFHKYKNNICYCKTGDRLFIYEKTPYINKRGHREYKRIYFSRMLVNAKENEFVDHKNHNGMDNRKCNLRLCTQSQNNANRKKYSGKYSSIYKGVSWNKSARNWQANGKCPKLKKLIYLGSFSNEQEAAKAYDAHTKISYGEFAVLNFNS